MKDRESIFLSIREAQTRLDNLKVDVGLCLILVGCARSHRSAEQHLDMLLVQHLFGLLGEVEGECESIRDGLPSDDVPF